jgi:hypothetical protein
VFTISHKWLSEFNEELKRNNLKIKYECITRADRMNEDVVKKIEEFNPEFVGIYTNAVLGRAAIELSRIIKRKIRHSGGFRRTVCNNINRKNIEKFKS